MTHHNNHDNLVRTIRLLYGMLRLFFSGKHRSGHHWSNRSYVSRHIWFWCRKDGSRSSYSTSFSNRMHCSSFWASKFRYCNILFARWCHFIIIVKQLFTSGFLIDFIAAPVVAGFTSAAAFTIATTQIEALLGLKFDDDGFVNTWVAVFRDIEQTRTWDAVLGFSSIAILLLLRVGYNCKLQ